MVKIIIDGVDKSNSEITSLTELSDVTLTSVANDNLLQYNSTSGEWENKTLANIADSTYLKLNGSNANTNIDIGAYNLTATKLSATNLEIDNDMVLGGNVLMDSNQWIGLGAAKGRIVFSDLATDTVTITDAKLLGVDATFSGLGTFGSLDVDTLNFNGNVISDSTGTISFDNDNITTTGDGTFNNMTLGDNAILKVDHIAEKTTNHNIVIGNKLDLTTSSGTGNVIIAIHGIDKLVFDESENAFDPIDSTVRLGGDTAWLSLDLADSLTVGGLATFNKINLTTSTGTGNVIIAIHGVDKLQYDASENSFDPIDSTVRLGGDTAWLSLDLQDTIAVGGLASFLGNVVVSGIITLNDRIISTTTNPSTFKGNIGIINTASGASKFFEVQNDDPAHMKIGTFGGQGKVTWEALEAGGNMVMTTNGGRVGVFEDVAGGVAEFWINNKAGIGATDTASTALYFGFGINLGGNDAGAKIVVEKEDVFDDPGLRKASMHFYTKDGSTMNLAMSIDENQNTVFTGDVKADTFTSSDGSVGITQTETSVNNFDITIKDGLITSFVKNS